MKYNIFAILEKLFVRYDIIQSFLLFCWHNHQNYANTACINLWFCVGSSSLQVGICLTPDTSTCQRAYALWTPGAFGASLLTLERQERHEYKRHGLRTVSAVASFDGRFIIVVTDDRITVSYIILRNVQVLLEHVQ
jgi:hypothetical protein